MRRGMRRRIAQLALVMVAIPIAARLLEEAARRAESRNRGSSSIRWLRQVAEFTHRLSRGPLARRPRG
jgi:hypothetical protein